MIATAYTFRISIDCPHCRAGVPVNAFTNEVLCNNCLNGIPLSQEWWESCLDNDTIEEALTFEPGNGNSSQHLGGMNEKIESGNRPPRCQKCKTDFPEELMRKSVDQGHFACPGCQQRIRVRKATPLVLSLIPEAGLLVHEDETGTGLGKDGHTATEPVLFACLACGAGLKVDGSSRTPVCAHCNSSNYLPDPLWLRLHPAAVSHAFFVTRGSEAKPLKVTVGSLPSSMDSEKALRMLKDHSLEPQVLDRIYELCDDDDDVHEALAKHPRTGTLLLLKLADSDRYYQVRAAVARRQPLPHAVFAVLATDSDSDVKEALVKRSDLFSFSQSALEDLLRGMDLDDLGRTIDSPGFPEWKLFELSDNCTPEDARRILRAPNVSLRVLKRLGSNPESRPLIKEHKQYKELGWWMKLFFFAGS
ncbi:MAG: hypothetical protein IPN95_14650 [Bacteroidetes bacterium]|jgi:DNA-directed RNA polymerase subunit RPC12/RpoP|nr:hypothetical protein [Bacteroidota bacterium]MBL0015991.1 hypothetical protein [Bacteroidota bacterium]